MITSYLWLPAILALCLSSVTVLGSTVNRRVCLNAASAQQHGLLSECIKEWKTYPWEAFRVDNSSDCSACRIISPFVWDSKISTLLCSNRMSSQECQNIIDALSKLKNIKNRNDVLCNILTLCDSHTYIKDLNFGVPLCDDCKRLVDDIRNMIKDNSTAVEIENQLDELVCNNLPGEIIPYCKNIINVHVPYLLQMLADSLSPDEICATLGFCGNAKVKFTLADFAARKRKCHENKKYSWIKRPSTSDNHKWTSYSTQAAAAPTCPECLNVLNQFKTGIEDSTIQERLKKLLDEKVCAHMGFFSAACREAVEYNFDQILSGVSQVDAKELCSLFGMCSNEEINLLSDESTLSTTRTTTSLSTKQHIPGVCQLCEMIVHKVFQLIAANRTEREIMLALETVCDYLPSNYKGQCVNFVDNYGVKVVEAIVEGTGPGLICTGIGLCSPFTSAVNEQQQQQMKLPSEPETTEPVKIESTVGIDACLTCKFFVETIYGQLQNNKTEDELRQLIKGACSILPSGFADRCSELIDRYFDDVLKLIENSYTPEQICHMISLCPALPFWSLSEQNPCLLGSEYWCRDYSTAKMCNAVHYCSSAGWKTYPSSNQNKMFKSQCELMKLPEICVNSELAKKCNRVNECYQEQVKKFLNLFSLSSLNIDNKTPCSVCVTMTTRWLLQWDIFGGPIINRNICDVYKDAELQQCYQVVEKAGMLLINSRKDRQRVEEICARTIHCSPVSGEDIKDNQLTYERLEQQEGFPAYEFERIACLGGPAYWCSSKDTAKKCNATNYCQATYWPDTHQNNNNNNVNEDVSKVESIRNSNEDNTVIPGIKTNSEHLLGIKPCTWGPAYWCMSEKTAKECGDEALSHCKEKVWTTKSTATTTTVTTLPHNKKYYGSEKCLRGPTFWCASFTNAKLCGDHAEKYCINYVWSNIHKTKVNVKKP
ncbi:unnamed protein product [Trichobilharzia szidati]|nr:unnamed protein product [Trichobilharzia szidati]